MCTRRKIYMPAKNVIRQQETIIFKRDRNNAE